MSTFTPFDAFGTRFSNSIACQLMFVPDSSAKSSQNDEPSFAENIFELYLFQLFWTFVGTSHKESLTFQSFLNHNRCIHRKALDSTVIFHSLDHSSSKVCISADFDKAQKSSSSYTIDGKNFKSELQFNAFQTKTVKNSNSWKIHFRAIYLMKTWFQGMHSKQKRILNSAVKMKT